jgi:hypothetical protein
LLTTATLTGTFTGDTITLQVPGQDGTLTQATFHAASLQDYNDAVAALRQRTSQAVASYNQAQATEQAVQATAQAVQAAQDAVQKANQNLSAALSALPDAEKTLSVISYSDTLSAFARDWKQMQTDYAKEQADAKNGCGDGNYNDGTVQYDAGSVDYDNGSIQYDDGTLSYDKNGYESALASVQSAEAAVKDAWKQLQQADSNNPTQRPGAGSPALLRLTFPHILQIDFVKELAKTTYSVEAGRASALSSRFPWTFPKMWGKVRLKRRGLPGALSCVTMN